MIDAGRRSRIRSVPGLAALLAAALVVLVPASVSAVRLLGVPVPLPALLATGLVVVAYAVIVALVADPLEGALAGTVVLATFAADIPLAPGSYPGSLGPRLWAFYPFVLATGAILLVRHGTDGLAPTAMSVPLAGLAGWSLLAGVVGGAVRLDAALWFSWYLFVGLALFAVVSATVRVGAVDGPAVLRALVVTCFAHVAYATAQVLAGGSFAVTTLGETTRIGRAPTVHVGPVGMRAGNYVSGFTGGSTPLVAMAVLVAPVALLYAVDHDRTDIRRGLALAGAVLCFVVVRFSMKDSGIGAGFVTLGVVLAALGWCLRSGWRPDRGSLGTVAVGVVGAIVALLLRSSKSGRTASTPDGGGNGGNSGGGGGGGESLREVSLPVLDLTTLGSRIRQTVVGLDLSARNPLFGVGGAGYPYVAPRYGVETVRGLDRALPIHNSYLSVLVGVGIPGFLLLSAFLAVVVLGLAATTRDETLSGWLGMGLFAGTVGYLGFAFFDLVVLSVTSFSVLVVLAGAVDGEWFDAGGVSVSVDRVLATVRPSRSAGGGD